MQLTLSVTTLCFIHIIPLVDFVNNVSDEVTTIAEAIGNIEAIPMNVSQAILIGFGIVQDTANSLIGNFFQFSFPLS